MLFLKKHGVTGDQVVYRTVAEKLQFYWNRNARIIIVTLLTLFCSIMTLTFT